MVKKGSVIREVNMANKQKTMKRRQLMEQGPNRQQNTASRWKKWEVSLLQENKTILDGRLRGRWGTPPTVF